MIVSFSKSELSESQVRWLTRFDSPHPFENSGRWYGCECGESRGHSIHVGVGKLDAEVRLPSYWTPR